MEDIIKAILPIIMLVIWVLSQVLGSNREQPAPRRPDQGGGGDDGPEEKELREEIEKFLRQAAGEQEEPKPPHEEPWEAGERERRREVQVQQQRHEQQREQQIQQEQRERQREQQRRREREIERERERERQRQRERQRLQEREAQQQADRGRARPATLPTRPTTRSEDIILAEAAISGLGGTQDALRPMSRLSHLESELERRRRSMDHDLISVDDHALREFGMSVTADDAASNDRPPSFIADMLRNSDDIRKAIILSEVLNRPIERW